MNDLFDIFSADIRLILESNPPSIAAKTAADVSIRDITTRVSSKFSTVLLRDLVTRLAGQFFGVSPSQSATKALGFRASTPVM